MNQTAREDYIVRTSIERIGPAELPAETLAEIVATSGRVACEECAELAALFAAEEVVLHVDPIAPLRPRHTNGWRRGRGPR